MRFEMKIRELITRKEKYATFFSNGTAIDHLNFYKKT